MAYKITAQQLYNNLNALHLERQIGAIIFNLAGVSVKINTTDTVGITLQSWLKQYLLNSDIYFAEPTNTQEFPDFFLDNTEAHKHMLEVKAFNYNATPAFDIANFESYCSSVKDKPYRLDADYLIFGYTMDDLGNITVKKIWLHKIWQIAGNSQRFPLKTQVKRGMIYNIRPNTDFKMGNKGPFNSKDDFLLAIYQTLVIYKGQEFADAWKYTLSINYSDYYGYSLPF
jgi:hypothetical protein